MRQSVFTPPKRELPEEEVQLRQVGVGWRRKSTVDRCGRVRVVVGVGESDMCEWLRWGCLGR